MDINGGGDAYSLCSFQPKWSKLECNTLPQMYRIPNNIVKICKFAKEEFLKNV